MLWPVSTIMDFIISVVIVAVVFTLLYKLCGGRRQRNQLYPDLSEMASSGRKNSLLQMYDVKHVNAIVDKFTCLEDVSKAVRKAGLESSNLIFGEYIHCSMTPLTPISQKVFSMVSLWLKSCENSVC